MASSFPKGSFTIDSVRYDWFVRHLAGASNPYSDARGISVEVALTGVSRKEMIVDFPFKDYGFLKPRSEAQLAERMKKCVRSALAKGWDPESKGKPYRVTSEFLEVKMEG
jgi:hypothetical protein